MRYLKLTSKYGDLYLKKSKFEGVQLIKEDGEPRLGIVFGATTIAVDDNKENRKALKLPCQD